MGNISSPDNKYPGMTRREFLRRAGRAAVVMGGVALVGGAASLVIKKNTENTESPLSVEDIKTLRLGEEEVRFKIGSPERVHISGMQWYPDGHTSFLKQEDGSVRAWIAGGPYGYMISGKDPDSLGQDAREVIGPSNKETFDRNYAAPGSVIPGRNENELFMFYHGEYHPSAPNSFPFTAGVGLAISHDKGVTWEKKGQIIKGKNDQPAKDRPSGAGQPCAIIKDNYAYLYYIDWNGTDPDAIHLARSPLGSIESPNSWEKFYEGKFVNVDEGNQSSPIILPAPEKSYAALPGISWNTHLNKFLGIIESRDGFYITSSTDGVGWETPQSLIQLQTANNNPKTGDTWNSYSTLWSLDASSDRETGRDMLLLYSEGKWGMGPHNMVKRKITIV